MDNQPPTVPVGIPLLDESTLPAADTRPELLVITGMSGAGRTRAAAALEDLDWYVVDNIPPALLESLTGLLAKGAAVQRLAVVLDVRSGGFFADLNPALEALRSQALPYRVVFLDASDEVLVRRFEQVRRPHPLQADGTILDGIGRERAELAAIRARADVVIDTSELSVHDLARRVRELVAAESDQRLRINVMSFGFKHGVPLDADHVIDVRFFANPYWVSELRHLTGRDEAVRDYVLGQEGAEEFVDNYLKLILPVLPGYERELKPYVSIAFGCTGGKHRSVAISEKVAEGLRAAGHQVAISHRDVGRE